MNADKAYQKALKELDTAMKELHAILRKHNSDQKYNKEDWGYVGDINFLKKSILDMLEGFKKQA